MTARLAEDFFSRVEKTDACWLWIGSRDSHGYGKFSIKGRAVAAHRFSFELENGPIGPGVKVCHRCDNPPCVRPSHLFQGTQADNMKDMVAKGRSASGDRSAMKRPDVVERANAKKRGRPNAARAEAWAKWRSEGRSGIPHSQERREHMRQKMAGRTFSPETIERMRQSALKREQRKREALCLA